MSAGRIDVLLDRAVDAVNRGELEVARQLATQVLATDAANPDAAVLSAFSPAGAPPTGQLRRLTVMFCDLVGSTALSTRHGPEQYRQILHRYKQVCRQIVEGTHAGHVARVVGDGLLVLFGHPWAREDDVTRAVRAGLDLVAAVRELSRQAEEALGESLAARVAVHRGLVYVDLDEDDVYGLAANVAARLQELAPPASVVVSAEVLALVGDRFETRAQEPEKVKGLDEPLASWRVVDERHGGEARHAIGGAAPPAAPTPPMVGRDRPRDQLRTAWAARPGVVLVRGEAGVGKTRLVQSLATDARGADEACVVQLAGSPHHTEVGFHPLRLVVEQRAGIATSQGGRERLRRLRRHLAHLGLAADRLIPLVAPVLAIEPDAGYEETATDARRLAASITDALAEYLRAALGTGPALLLVEDLQWVDAATRGVVLALVGDQPDNLLVVATGRERTRPPTTGTAVVELAPLSPADCRQLVAALDPVGVVDDLDQLVARSDGIPLYLEHLVRSAVDARPRGEAQPPDDRPPVAVPEPLYEPLLARLDAIPGGLPVAGAAATVGREVDVALLAQVVETPAHELQPVLDALVAGSVLEVAEPPGARAPRGRYRFRHELLREVAYELQPPSARRRLHGRVADAVAAAAATGGGAPDWPALAEHYARADRPGAALGAHQQSAEQARRRGALVEARADLDRAVDLLWELEDSPQRVDREVELRLRRGFLAVSTEGNASPTAAADYQRCLDLATGGRSSDAMFTTLISLWGYYASRAQLARARQVLQTLRTVLADGREWARPENDAGFGMLDWFAGRFPAAHEQLERAVAAVEGRAGHAAVRAEWFLPNDPQTAMWTHLGLARFMRGDPAGADAAFAAAQRSAADLAFPQGPFSAAYNLTYAAWTRIQRAEHAAAGRTIDQVQALVDRHGFDFWALAVATQRAELAAAQARTAAPAATAADPAGGAWPPAAAPAGTSPSAHGQVLAGLVAAWQMIDTRVFLPTVLTSLAFALGAAGERDAARERCAEALSLAEKTGSRFFVPETLRAQAQLDPDPDDADRTLRHALQVATDQGAVPLRLRIARDLVLRHGDVARPELLAALGAFRPDASYPELDAARALAVSVPGSRR